MTPMTVIPTKPWYRSRILWLNLVVAGGSTAAGFTGILPAWAVSVLTVLVALANVVLRYDTDHAIE